LYPGKKEEKKGRAIDQKTFRKGNGERLSQRQRNWTVVINSRGRGGMKTKGGQGLGRKKRGKKESRKHDRRFCSTKGQV